MLAMLLYRLQEVAPPAVTEQPAGGAWDKRRKGITYGELMDMWANEKARLEEIARREERERHQPAGSEVQTESKTEKVRKELAALQRERREVETRAALLRLQAEALARNEQIIKAQLLELEEEEAIAMAMIALML